MLSSPVGALALRSLGKWAYAALGSMILSVQIASTILDINIWPFCSYNVFNFIAPERGMQRIWVALYDDVGKQQIVTPGNVVRLEFFRANALFNDVYIRSSNTLGQMLLAELIIKHLNERPWSAFDETMRAARPTEGSQFVGLDVLVGVGSRPSLDRSEGTLFSYRRLPSSNQILHR